MARIEFYDGSAEHPFAHVNSDAVPRDKELINIRKQTWAVVCVTWALDSNSPDPLRANVDLRRL